MKQYIRAEGDYLMYRVPRTCFDRSERVYVDEGREAIIVCDGIPGRLLRAGDQAALYAGAAVGEVQLYFFNKRASGSVPVDIGDRLRGSCRMRVSNAPLLLSGMRYATGRLSARELLQYMRARLCELTETARFESDDELERRVCAEFERCGIELCELCGKPLCPSPPLAHMEVDDTSPGGERARVRRNRESRNELANLLLGVRREMCSSKCRGRLYSIENRLMLSETSSRDAEIYDAQIRELAAKLPEIAHKGFDDILDAYITRISELIDRRAV